MRDLATSDLRRLYYQRQVDPGKNVAIADAFDISSGVTAELHPFRRWTLYLRAAAAVSITLELSPDGATFFSKRKIAHTFLVS